MKGCAIFKLPMGGYMVKEWGLDYVVQELLFACSHINDALQFVKEHLEKNDGTQNRTSTLR